ncbi:MAG: hypothetical protein OEY26_09140 [Nitrospinota bacterium]|nr:hypothetical protein [Nitrospinota bacterium]
MHEDPNRNPVIVIPGLLGSKLVDLDTGKLFLIVGDAEKTKMTAQINPEGGIKIIKTGPGDGTVLRSSALMDERISGHLDRRLVSPIHWNQVHFIFSDHLGFTKSPAFTDNILYFLLECPLN